MSAVTTLPGTVRPDVVLHLGVGKTGTTTIQHLMRLSRPVLAEHGYLYPRTPGPVRHAKLGLYFRSDEELETMPAWHRLRAQSPERFRRRFRRKLMAEIAEARPDCVVFSDEALYGLSASSRKLLRGFVDELGGDVRLVVYLRRQDEHLTSYYQQHVKIGETRRLAEWAADDRSSTYDYARRLSVWETSMAPATLVVRRFERGAFKGGSLEADFLDAAGIVGVEPVTLPRKNESLDAETVEFLRVLNLYLVRHAGETAGLIDHRDLVSRLVQHTTGPTLTLPDHQLEEFLARWQSSNTEVASTYLGERELFAEGRKDGTTAVQHLDPSRVDHYLEIGELARDIRDDLRRIAVDEARRGPRTGDA
jgi:hypothetical protein